VIPIKSKNLGVTFGQSCGKTWCNLVVLGGSKIKRGCKQGWCKHWCKQQKDSLQADNVVAVKFGGAS